MQEPSSQRSPPTSRDRACIVADGRRFALDADGAVVEADDQAGRDAAAGGTAERSARSALALAGVGYWRLGLGGAFDASPELHALLDLPATALTSLDDLLARMPGIARDALRARLVPGTADDFDLRHSLRVGPSASSGERLSVVHRGLVAADGSVLGVVKCVDDAVTESLNHFDAQTGLPGAHLFARAVDNAIDRASGHHQCVAVAYLRVTSTNPLEVAGAEHAQRLGRLARRLGELVVARHLDSATIAGEPIVLGRDNGGFVLLLTRATPEAAARLGTSVCEVVTQGAGETGLPEPLQATVGIALSPFDGTSADALVRAAERTARDVKANALDRVRFCSDGLQDRVQAALQLPGELRLAFARGEMQLAYTPLLDLRRDAAARLYGVSIDLCWLRDGTLSGDFAGISARASMAGLDDMPVRILLQLLIDELGRMPDGDFAIHVPLDLRQIDSQEVEHLLTALATSPALGSRRLLVEIDTYDTRIGGPLAARLSTLRDSGVQLALGGFGAYAPWLARLRELPFDAVRLDAGVVRELGAVDASPSLLTSLVAIAHALGLDTLAVGVDDEALRARLAVMGVDAVRGTAIGRARSVDHIDAWLPGDNS